MMRVICIYIMLFTVVKSLASSNFNTDTRLVIHPDNLIFVLLPNGGWLEMIDLLKQVNVQKVSDLMRNHEDLFVDNTRLSHRLLTSVLRHSLCQMMVRQFQKGPLQIIEEATKLKLEIFLERLSSTNSMKMDLDISPSTDVIQKKFLTQEILNRIKAGEYHLSSEIDELRKPDYEYLIEIAEAIIVNQELEYLEFAISDSRISRFLKELYSLMSEDDSTAEKIINTKMENLELRPGELLSSPDYGVLKKLFLNTGIYQIITSFADFFKNRDTSAFLQFTIVRHCKMHYLIKKLERADDALVILQRAKELKLKDVKVNIEKIITGSYFPSPDLSKKSISETGIDLRNDNIFSSLSGTKSFPKLGSDQISRVEDALSMWIDEEVQLAIVRPEFYKFLKKIFEIIDKGNADTEVNTLVRQVEYIR